MSVLDRAIVKAFERRSRSLSTDPQSDLEKLQSAPVSPPDVSGSVTARVDASLDSLNSTLSSGISSDGPKFAELVEPELAPRDSQIATGPPSSLQQDVTLHDQSDRRADAPRSDLVLTESKLEEETRGNEASKPDDSRTADVSHGPESTLQTWHWPAICEQLDQFTGDGFRELAKHLQYTADQGNKVLAFASSQRDVGRTSVLLTLTRILALEGKSRVLLIDADTKHPHIAELASLTPQVGLEKVLQGAAPIDEALISLSPGRVMLLPLIAPVTEREWAQISTQMRSFLPQAKRDFDLILIDAGVQEPQSKLSECWLRGIANAVVTVARQLSVQRAEHVVLDWKQIGIESLGVIETFA